MIAATAFISKALLTPSSSEGRKVICYLLIAAPNSLKDSGVGMDPSRLRAATGGAKGNWERSVYLRKR